MEEWPFEDLVTVQLRGSALWDWGSVLREAVYALNQFLIYGAIS